MRWGWAHTRELPISDLLIPVASPEYIGSMKLRYFAMSVQNKYLRDIRSMLRITPDLDRRIITQWATHYGVGEAWRLVQATA